MSTEEITRPAIDVTDGNTARHADETWTELVRHNDPQHPQVMLRGDKLVRLKRDPNAQRGEPQVVLSAYISTSLVDRMSRVADFYKEFTTGRKLVNPPSSIASTLIHRDAADLPEAPRVNRVTDIPVYGENAEGEAQLITEPGHSPVARVYYIPAPGLEKLKVPDWDPEIKGLTYDPGRQTDVEEARNYILEMLDEFPFADEHASRAHCVCMLVEPFVRELIGAAPTPPYVIDGVQPGVGKGLLAEICLYPGCGPVPASFLPKDTDEQEKRITADLLRGPMAILYDNLPEGEQVRAPGLAAALTAPAGQWSGRIIGSSEKPTVPIRNVWVMTGNNINLHKELVRRSIPILLDRKTQTKYKLQLPRWAHENRYLLAQAAIILAHNYVVGFHEVDDEGELVATRESVTQMHDSFPAWTRIMGGILKAADIPGFLDNKEKFAETADVGSKEIAEFYADWYDRTNGERLTVDEIKDALFRQGTEAGSGGIPLPLSPVAFPAELRVREADFKAVFSKWLYGKRDAEYGGLILRKHEGRHSKWCVEKVT